MKKFVLLALLISNISMIDAKPKDTDYIIFEDAMKAADEKNIEEMVFCGVMLSKHCAQDSGEDEETKVNWFELGMAYGKEAMRANGRLKD